MSWQVIPPILGQLIGHEDPAKAKSALDAMLTMKKIDIAALERAVA